MSIPRATRVRDHGTARAPSRTESTTEPGVAARPMFAVGWSLYGAPWLQLVAISGKSDGRGRAENKPKPLPFVATGCREKYMVRRGSTVRVRQGALQKACTAAAYRAEPLAPSSTCGGYGALYGAFRSKTSSAARAESPLAVIESRRKVADLMVA